MKALHRHTLAKAIQLSLLLGLPLAATAQDAPAPGATTLDTVTVTGSRIKKADLETQVPVQTLTREDIERTGLTSIGDVLQEITGSGSALNTKFNSSGNFGFPPDGSGVGAGSATMDLRHLGCKRVLVLVDGIRWVSESSASGVSSCTDLNTIPLAIVERIDVLEDGASSLYGSDAIAGVVNIITRRTFDGFQISGNYGQYTEGDGEQWGADFSYGGSTDRASWFVGLSHFEQKEVSSGSRELSSVPTPGTGIRFGSSGIPAGRFIFTDPNTGATLDLVPNVGVVDPTYDPTQTGCVRTDGFHCFTNDDRFNFSPYNMVLTPSERNGIFGQFRFQVTDNINWYAKALWNRRESTNRAAPEPIFLGPEAGTFNPQADGIFISGTNPYNPFGFDLDSASNLILIGRRPTEGGARVFEQEVDTAYFATGLEGQFGVGDKTWFWDVNFATSKNEADQTNFGSYNIRNIALALGDLATCQATPGCVPLDIWGANSITPEMLAWIQPVVRDHSENELHVFSANLSGDLFEMPAGPLAFAAGYEYRKYEGSYTPDPITVAGDYNGVPSLPTSGDYDINEVFVELSVPLMKDTAFGKSLDLSLAGRYSDYSTFGGEFTPKIGMRWQLVDELMFRGTYAEGFRAPSIGELYGSPARFDATINDPCSTPLANPGLAANCAALGVPADYEQPNPQISVLTGGNEDLTPETSKSYSLGMVWSPSVFEDTAISQKVDLEITYYRHEMEDAIQAADAQTVLNRCVGTLDPFYCAGIGRAITGGINRFDNTLGNLGEIETDGFDVDLFWTFPETSFGVFKMSWMNTFVASYESRNEVGALEPRQPGIETNNGAIPDWTSNLNFDWRLGAWSASWTTRHISDLREDCGRAQGFPICSNPAEGPTGINRMASTTYHDLQVGYKFDWMKGLQLTAGVNNLFDKDPPACLSCAQGGYDASNYDLPGGGFWYVRADLRF